MLSQITTAEAEKLLYDWRFWGRPNQLEPHGDWRTWLILAGRGSGKTRTGAETARSWIESGRFGRIALVAPTSADGRDVMVEGESGLLSICPPWNRPHYEPSKRRLTWGNGAIATIYSADEPERLRGPQHDAAWCDEIAAWKYMQDAWDMLMFGLRLGSDPRVVLTTTPKPLPLIRELMNAPSTYLTRGSTYDNRANLAPAFLSTIITKYEGTRLGRQELLAEFLDDVPGALWTRAMIEAAQGSSKPDLWRVVVAVDPAVTATDESDETAIVGVGQGVDLRGYILADLSCRTSPGDWAQRAVNLYRHLKADAIVAETNNGGDLVEHAIRTVDPRVPVVQVRASRGKIVRAEPIAALYEQGRVSHVAGHEEIEGQRRRVLERLEDQMCSYAPGSMMKSPDRMDALVWGLTALFLGEPEPTTVVYDDRRLISAY